MTDIFLSGNDHAVLLLHGLYGNPQEMYYIGRQLHKKGYTICIPYIHGCGVSDDKKKYRRSRWQDWLAQVEKQLDSLLQRYRKVSVAGLCAGANLALALAIKRTQDIHTLCLYSTTLYYDGWNLTWLKWLRPLAYHTPLKYYIYFHERPPFGLKNERIRKWVADQMRSTSESDAGAAKSSLVGVYQNERLIKHIKQHIGNISCPTLIIHAREDDTTSPRSADFVYRHISSPVRQQIMLENSYHIITMDNEKDRVAQETLDFIASNTPVESQP